MNSLFRKEIRLLFWPWVGAAFVVSVPVWIYSSQSALIWDRDAVGAISSTALLSYFCLAAAVLMLALTSFGYEFTAKTFSLFLSQPVSRQTLWRIKTIVLAFGLLIVVGLHLLTLSLVLHSFAHAAPPVIVNGELHDAFRVVPIIALIGCAGGLWTTLVFRNIAAALSVTIIAPVIVLIFEDWMVRHIARRYVDMDILVPWTFVAYAIAAFAFAWWYFLRAQDVPWTGGTLSWSGRQNLFLKGFSAFRRSGKIAAFIRKELQLQQISFLIAGLVLLCHLGSFVLRLLGWVQNSGRTAPSATAYLINNIWLLWLALPVLIASSAVAEERRLGTLEALLTQPISRRVQLLIKVVLVFAAGVFFGAVVPAQIEKLWNFVGPHNVLRSWMGLEGSLKISLGLTACALFASAISRHTIEAICLAIVLTPLAATGLGFISSYGEPTAYICIALVTAVSVWLLWRNYQRPQLRNADSAFTWSALACSALLGWGGTAFTYYRGWELFLPLEPKHHQPVWNLTDHAKIFSSGHGPIALLPDGRIWTAQYDDKMERAGNGDMEVTDLWVTNSTFIAGTNWVDVAASYQSYGIKSDGTLWWVRPIFPQTNQSGVRFWKTEPPRQVGTDTNWSSVVAGNMWFAALKRDGSLWGWGHLGISRDEPNGTINLPTRLWNDSDWLRIFGVMDKAIAIKRDGSIWSWGPAWTSRPVPMSLTGTNWTSFAALSRGVSGVQFLLATRNDGTLWECPAELNSINEMYKTFNAGKFQRGIGFTVFGERYFFANQPTQLGKDTDWRCVSGWMSVVGLKTDGTWYLAARNPRGPKPSHYSDWLAVSPQFDPLTLATDGTISSWVSLRPYNKYLAPSHRPAWSTNIFATAR